MDPSVSLQHSESERSESQKRWVARYILNPQTHVYLSFTELFYRDLHIQVKHHHLARMRIHPVRLQHLSLLEEVQLRCFRTLTSEKKVKKNKHDVKQLSSRFTLCDNSMTGSLSAGWCRYTFEFKGHVNEPHLPL